MKLEFNMAADVELVTRSPQPISAPSPARSSAVTPSTPMRETGSCAPTRAQAMPSRTRCLARSRTDAGTSSSVVLATQVASLPVGPAGSVAGRACLPGFLAVVGVAMQLPVSDGFGVLRRACLDAHSVFPVLRVSSRRFRRVFGEVENGAPIAEHE